jgi:hypothetical protein
MIGYADSMLDSASALDVTPTQYVEKLLSWVTLRPLQSSGPHSRIRRYQTVASVAYYWHACKPPDITLVTTHTKLSLAVAQREAN